MKVAVFGGAEPKAGEPAYQEASRLGQILALAGHTVVTGGYIGTMEAVSRGASEAGGHVVGVTCRQIEDWRDVRPNAWVREEWRSDTLPGRLEKLLGDCDAAIALPGGVGTLVEIGLLWNLMLIRSLSVRPLVLVGSAWKKVFDTFFSALGEYVSSETRTHLRFARDIEEAVRMIG
jgi:uncharacterized protein (TIGR00730 family)